MIMIFNHLQKTGTIQFPIDTMSRYLSKLYNLYHIYLNFSNLLYKNTTSNFFA